jgi:hypothetical protein
MHRRPNAGGTFVAGCQVKSLRAFLLKGGFIMFDDFDGDWDWRNLVTQMKAVLPDHEFIRLEVDHPIFQSFVYAMTH